MYKLDTHLTIGEHISKVAQAAVDLVKAGEPAVSFEFNEQTLVVTPGMSAADVCKVYDDECEARHKAYIASPEYKEREREAVERERRRVASLNAWLEKAPAKMTLAKMTLHGTSGEDNWAKANAANPDGYGSAIMTYAERWARVMEAMMVAGRTLNSCADEASHLADTERITGFMYGATVSTLSTVWIHGEALRRWHNGTYGKQGEKANESGSVINPALLTINAK